MDWEPLILGLVIFDILLSIWLARMLALTVQATVSQLDIKIAEPPNPIQMALADLLKSRLADARGSGEPVELPRASDGRFSG